MLLGDFTMKVKDFDVNSPNQVPVVLREIADLFYQASINSPTTGQDKGIVRLWKGISNILKIAAGAIEMNIRRYHEENRQS
jgi:hypothetical protein